MVYWGWKYGVQLPNTEDECAVLDVHDGNFGTGLHWIISGEMATKQAISNHESRSKLLSISSCFGWPAPATVERHNASSHCPANDIYPATINSSNHAPILGARGYNKEVDYLLYQRVSHAGNALQPILLVS